MGYILPIEPYQHMNYQLREVRANRKVSSMERSFPVRPLQQYPQLPNEQVRQPLGQQKSATNSEIRAAIALITGKGRTIDQAV